MTKRAPYMPLYGKDAWNDEKFAALPWDVQGLFWRLAYWQWAEGSIPSNVEIVIDMVGKPRETRRLWTKMQAFFLPIPGNIDRLANAHMEELRQEMLARKSKNQEGAGKTNGKRWGSQGDSHSDSKMHRSPVASRVATATTTVSTSTKLDGESEGKPNARPDFGQVTVRNAADVHEAIKNGKLLKMR